MPKRNASLTKEFVDYEQALAQEMGARIEARRKELGLNQAQVRAHMAEARVAITRAQFSRVENGESLVNAAELIALAAVLGVSVQWLLEGDTEATRVRP